MSKLVLLEVEDTSYKFRVFKPKLYVLQFLFVLPKLRVLIPGFLRPKLRNIKSIRSFG
jgi:hypothetical protein